MSASDSRARTLSRDWENVLSVKTSEDEKMKETIFEKPNVEFCTGSSYVGQWNKQGMEGFGTFLFPHGVEYEGTLKDGMFDGEGTLTYPQGQKIDGFWSEGRMVSYKFRFADCLEYEEPWGYCKMPDRRYAVSIQEGLNPAGREMLTNLVPPRIIPEGCYDTGDGFYNPKTKCIYSPKDIKRVLRIPTAAEEAWIVKHCRRDTIGNVGHRPDLYERWMAGRRLEDLQFRATYEDNKDQAESAGAKELLQRTAKLTF